MNNRVSKAQPRRRRVRLSKSLQEQLLNAIAIPSQVGPGLPQDAPAKSTKRQLNELDFDQPLAKKARLTNAQQPELEGERAQPADKTPILQHPKPKPRYASFLEKFVNPFQPGRRADSEHSFILEWLETIGSERDSRCRSDSHLDPAESPIPRQFTRSAPAMGYTRDVDVFAVLPIPGSTGSRSRADSNSRSVIPSDVTGSTSGPSGRSLVENPYYRQMNLATNNIYMRSSRDRFPDNIANLINSMRRDRDSPGPTLNQVWEDKALEELGMGAAEPEVEKYFQNRIFPDGDPADSIKCSDRQPMAKHIVPSVGSNLKVSTPVPDTLYGYNRQNAFPQQQAQLISMGTEMAANTQYLLYPFFVVEFKAEGPSGAGNLWVATNQCLGGSASCVNIAENLNCRLRQCETEAYLINSAAFSIAMSGTEARLYISWKQDELAYHMANIDSFLLQDPEHYVKFRKYVRNIIDWGRGARLEEIRKSLHSLLEENRKRASAAAKSRMPPTADSAGSSSGGKARKTSSTRQKSRRSSSTQRQSSGAEGEYWEWDGTFGRWFHRNADGTLSWAEEGEQRPEIILTGQASGLDGTHELRSVSD